MDTCHRCMWGQGERRWCQRVMTTTAKVNWTPQFWQLPQNGLVDWNISKYCISIQLVQLCKESNHWSNWRIPFIKFLTELNRPQAKTSLLCTSVPLSNDKPPVDNLKTLGAASNKLKLSPTNSWDYCVSRVIYSIITNWNSELQIIREFIWYLGIVQPMVLLILTAPYSVPSTGSVQTKINMSWPLFFWFFVYSWLNVCVPSTFIC